MRKISPSTGIRSPDRPSRSQSLYRLRYPAHFRMWGYAYLKYFAEIFYFLVTIRMPFPKCEERHWRKKYSRESEELYNEPNVVKVIKCSRLRWVGHVVRMDDNELTKKILWTNPGGQRGRGRPKSRWIDGVEEDTRKLGCRIWRADGQDGGSRRHLFEEAKAHPGL